VALGAFGFAYKAVDFFKSGLKGASNLNETLSKTDAILGDASPAVKAYADEVAQRFGLVKQDTLDAASAFAGLGKGLAKLSGANLSKFSIQFTQLAADLMSFANIDMSTATEALQTGLAGNQSDVLKKLGVVLLDDTVKAYAFAHGIAKAGKDLTEAQKVTARAGIIMKSLADAQGDLARTADSPANAMRKFQGSVQNLANDIGTVFLPAMQVGLRAANEFVQLLTKGFASAKGSWESFAANVAAGFDTIGVVFRNFPLVVDIVVLKFREMSLNAIAYIGVIPQNLAIIAGYIAGNWRQLITDAVNAVGAVFKNLGTNLGELSNSIYQFLKDPTKGFQFNWKPLLDGFQATAAQLPKMIQPELVSMQKEIDAKAAEIAKNEAARAAKEKPAEKKKEEEEKEAAGKKKKKKKEDVTAGAFVLGSQEAASAVAQYGNRAKDAAAMKTADNTAQANKILQRIEAKLAPAVRAGQPIAAREF
jgi:hypothetical protein